MLMTDERFNATLALRFPTIPDERTVSRDEHSLLCLGALLMSLDARLRGGCECSFGTGRSFHFLRSKGNILHSMAKAFLESIKHVFFFLLRGLPVTDRAGVMYEYRASRWPTCIVRRRWRAALASVNAGGFGWRSAGGGHKMDNQVFGLG